jgi:hypothetical protein
MTLFQVGVEAPVDLFGIFGTLAALVVGITVVAEFIDRLGWHLEALAAQLRALAVGIILGAVGAYFKFGMFADPAVTGGQAWYVSGPLIGLLAGFPANWAFATPAVKFILELLKLRPKQA